jgi:hypothetical protein
MRDIFIVQGSTGEYSDLIEWLVAAFASEEKAKELAANAKAEADRLFEETKDDNPKRYGAKNKFDDQMIMDWNNVIYGVIKIKLYE